MSSRICQGCGSVLKENERFCSKCGRAVEEPVCQYCGAKVLEGARFCTNCGKEIGPRSCPKCGKEILPNARFCTNCGQEVGVKPPPEKAAQIPLIDNKKTDGIDRQQPTAAKPAKTTPSLLDSWKWSKMRWPNRLALIISVIVLLGVVIFSLAGNGDNGATTFYQAPVPPASVAAEGRYAPTTLQYTDRDSQVIDTNSLSGCITIIANENAAPDAVKALVKELGGGIYAEIPDCGMFFTDGFPGREADVVAALNERSDIIDDAFPTPACVAKGECLVEDFKVKVTREDGYYLHLNDDGTVSWEKEAEGALTHGQVSTMLAGSKSESRRAIDCGYTVKEDGRELNLMDTGNGLKAAAAIAKEDRERGEVTVVNNSWGAVFDVREGASTVEYEAAAKKFLNGERNAYFSLMGFLDRNPNAIAVKAAGNEGMDITDQMNKAEELKYGNDWDRLVIVGVLDENGHPTKYSNYASGRTDIIWVPEYQTADGKPVPGTSFGAPQISYLLTKMAQARPDLKPDQLVSILYDYRVSPRVNLRPTIEHPYSAATLQAALDVAEEKYGPKKDTSEITAETESELELLPLPEPEPQPEPEFEIIQETEPATEDEWNGPLSGIYQGTSQYHEVWDCFWIYVSDVRETLTVHLRQKGSQVEGIIICSDVTWTSESDDPFDPAEPFFIPLLNYDAFTAEVDANGNLGFTYLQLGGIEYTRMSHSPLERVYSGTISGNSMTLNFFTKDSDLERTGTFTASRISGRFDEAVFEEYYGRWEELAQ